MKIQIVATRDKANIVVILLQSNKEVINSKLNFDFVFFLSLFVGLLNPCCSDSFGVREQ
jgi:hypothetical protein